MTTTIPEVTFEVAKVQSFSPLPQISYNQALRNFLGSPLESCSCYHGKLVDPGPFNPLVSALHLAFQSHYPIRLSPDMIWLTICQGLALHINAHAEELRRHFVQHEGQLEIIVQRDEFRKGSPENDWPGVFAEFSKVIKTHIGASHSLIVADFSTTGPVERAASEIALLDAMQSYFKYTVRTKCGIPAITLEGTAEDWHAVLQRVQKLGQFGLNWWVEPLLPILAEFENAARGRVRHTFWKSIYHYHSMSGGAIRAVG